MKAASRTIVLPAPDMQISFTAALSAARQAYLVDALAETVREVEIPLLDAELARHVPHGHLRALAAMGIRAELVFPVPMILERKPRLLAYYRLLLGHSQKAFYEARNGTSRFRSMEDEGLIPPGAPVAELCSEMIRVLGILVEGIGPSRITRELLDDLTLLTLGPQFRGGANVRKGGAGIDAVCKLIQSIVRPSVTATGPGTRRARRLSQQDYCARRNRV